MADRFSYRPTCAKHKCTVSETVLEPLVSLGTDFVGTRLLPLLNWRPTRWFIQQSTSSPVKQQSLTRTKCFLLKKTHTCSLKVGLFTSVCIVVSSWRPRRTPIVH